MMAKEGSATTQHVYLPPLVLDVVQKLSLGLNDFAEPEARGKLRETCVLLQAQ